MVRTGNLKRDLPVRPLPDEVVGLLLDRPGVRIERIVSTGQTTPEGLWYDQETDEWVLVVAGAARLRIEGEATDRELGEGDWILLPAHCRHRVTWTRAEPPTVWLAVHFTANAFIDSVFGDEGALCNIESPAGAIWTQGNVAVHLFNGTVSLSTFVSIGTVGGGRIQVVCGASDHPSRIQNAELFSIPITNLKTVSHD